MTAQETMTWLQIMIGPLLGVVVGALLSWLAAAGLERARFRHERGEKLAGLRREAISAALEWIDPMRNALIKASSLVTAAIHGRFDDEAFLRDYPYLLGELKKHDLTGAQRAVLPDGVYSRGHDVVRQFDELQFLGVEHGEQATARGKTLSGFDEISNKIDEIDSKIESLESDLRAAFQSTLSA